MHILLNVSPSTIQMFWLQVKVMNEWTGRQMEEWMDE